MTLTKSPDQLAREDIIRETLLEAAKRIEAEDGNPLYKRAWKRAVNAVLKPLTAR